MRFSFVGNFSLDETKENNIRKANTKTGMPYISLRPSVVAAKNNRGFCEIFGCKQDTIKTTDKDGNSIEVDWKNRTDKEVIDTVAGYRKNIIVLNGERHEFISAYDFCDFILENLEELKDKRVLVTGNTSKDFYNGKSRDRFTISSIYEIKEDDDRKNSLGMTGVIYWDKDCVDLDSWKSDKKIYINAYTSEYISKDEGRKYVKGQFVLDCSKVDFENEKHIAQLQLRLEQLGLSYEQGKIKINLKAKGIAHNEFQFTLQNGAEEIEFTIDQCTDLQKKWIEAGIKTLEDFRPRGGTYGERITEYKFKTPTFMGNYSDGMLYLDMKPSEFEDEVYVVLEDEDINDLPFDGMNEPEELDDEDEIEDLFG